MPTDWDACIADLAIAFHFQPSELWAMEVDEMTFWLRQAEKRFGG